MRRLTQLQLSLGCLVAFFSVKTTLEGISTLSGDIALNQLNCLTSTQPVLRRQSVDETERPLVELSIKNELQYLIKEYELLLLPVRYDKEKGRIYCEGNVLPCVILSTDNSFALYSKEESKALASNQYLLHDTLYIAAEKTNRHNAVCRLNNYQRSLMFSLCDGTLEATFNAEKGYTVDWTSVNVSVVNLAVENNMIISFMPLSPNATWAGKEFRHVKQWHNT